MNILEVENLHCSFGKSEVLKGVSLKVKKGETVGLIGPNGSGKSTLFNCLSGFHPRSSGSIVFKGNDISSLRPFERARLGMGRVFQSSGVFREQTVLQNMLIALESRSGLLSTILRRGAAQRQRKQDALELLEEVGLSDKAGEIASSLSGGQLRLLEIARALAYGSELLLLDEPTAGVSPKLKGEVVKMISALKSKGLSLLLIEHDMNLIGSLCDRIAVMESGRIILEGAPTEVRQSKLLHQIYFGDMPEVESKSTEN